MLTRSQLGGSSAPPSPNSRLSGSSAPPSPNSRLGGSIPPVPPIIMIQAITNPYRASIDVTKSDGLKLFRNATKGLPDDQKFDLSLNTVRKFRKHAENAAINFNWGAQVFKVPSGADHFNLLTQHNQLSEAAVIADAKTIWDFDADKKITDQISGATPDIADKRVRSVMISAWIRNSMTESANYRLDCDKAKFQFSYSNNSIEEHGPLMLKTIFDRVNPTTKIGVERLEEKIRSIRLSDHNQDVSLMLDAIQELHDEISYQDGPLARYESLLFRALLSGTNVEFKNAMQRKKDDWDDGTAFTYDEIKSAALRKYNNLVEVSTVPPMKSASALATNAEDTSGLKNNNNSGGINNGPPSGSTGPRHSTGLKEWRKTKSFGEKVFKDDAWHWWCPHHVYPGVYDGLYMTHPPEEHDKWQERKDKYKANRKKGKSKDSASEPSGKSDGKPDDKLKLGLNDKMKTALMTNHGFTELQIEAFASELHTEKN